MQFTKCADCRKWDRCGHCGTCHTCRPDVRDLCLAVRAVDTATHDQKLGQMVRKHQASTFTQDPGIGANGCEPRVTARLDNWYGSDDYREWARASRDAQKAAKRADAD